MRVDRRLPRPEGVRTAVVLAVLGAALAAIYAARSLPRNDVRSRLGLACEVATAAATGWMATAL